MAKFSEGWLVKNETYYKAYKNKSAELDKTQ